MQIAVRCDPFDSRHLAAVRLDGEHGARFHRPPVEQDCAGTACRRVAADVRAGEAELLAQEVDEKLARLDLGLVANAVDGNGDPSHALLPCRTPERRAYDSCTWISRRSKRSSADSH